MSCPAPTPEPTGQDRWLCHCLQVTEAEIRQAIDRGEVGSLEDVFNSTGAGIGCTACHRRILKVLKQARIDEGMPAERLQPAGH